MPNKPMVPTATCALAEPALPSGRRHIGQPFGVERRNREASTMNDQHTTPPGRCFTCGQQFEGSALRRVGDGLFCSPCFHKLIEGRDDSTPFPEAGPAREDPGTSG